MSFIADLLKRGLQKQEAEIYRSILGVDFGKGADMTVAVTTARLQPPLVTPGQIDRMLLIHGQTFAWQGQPWDAMSPAEREKLCAQEGLMILDAITRRAVDTARQREEAAKMRALDLAREREEFLDYCAKQHPGVLEEFRRVRLVKSKLSRFAGVAKEA